ncbi:hypothetical protein NEMBOFW57_000725 [Staphylotrichum longicolle]|uniref:Uncharacterized protein n=1 Tax=Staphylotrichum longicolle TaxID=669026 RepID=A0AAD4F390_9PEZI|nr:hypothetical protein NEMBOFW57_000725 [Staphylotrichum longicolle]
MANRDGRISSRWVWPLLVLASTASAFSLSNFQVISSTSVPLGCILAYNSPIPGCSMNDFVKGRVCSAACVRGLTRVQLTLQSACYDVNADAATVLGQVLLGNLVALVCPEPTTLTVPPTTSRPALTLTTLLADRHFRHRGSDVSAVVFPNEHIVKFVEHSYNSRSARTDPR